MQVISRTIVHRHKRRFSALVLFPLLTGLLMLPVPAARAQVVDLPQAGDLIKFSPGFNPTLIKGVTINSDNPLLFDFIIDRGDAMLEGEALEKETEKLVKYFLAGLTIPDDDVWVNLSPYEHDLMIPQILGVTEMGRDLLAQDYLLKQVTASITNPEDSFGQDFWDRVYRRANEEFGTTEIPINTFSKVWIVPDRAEILEKDGTAYVADAHLKVMLEEDYLAIKENLGKEDIGTDELSQDEVEDINNLSATMVAELVIPEIEKEVNEGKNFALVRQIYSALILSTWYKQALKDSLLNQVYTDRNKVAGVNIDDPQVKEEIYNQYMDALKKGVYNVVKDDYDPVSNMIYSRRYYSGGATFQDMAPMVRQGIKPDIPALTPAARQNATRDLSLLSEGNSRFIHSTVSLIEQNPKNLPTAIQRTLNANVSATGRMDDQLQAAVAAPPSVPVLARRLQTAGPSALASDTVAQPVAAAMVDTLRILQSQGNSRPTQIQFRNTLRQQLSARNIPDFSTEEQVYDLARQATGTPVISAVADLVDRELSYRSLQTNRPSQPVLAGAVADRLSLDANKAADKKRLDIAVDAVRLNMNKPNAEEFVSGISQVLSNSPETKAVASDYVAKLRESAFFSDLKSTQQATSQLGSLRGAPAPVLERSAASVLNRTTGIVDRNNPKEAAAMGNAVAVTLSRVGELASPAEFADDLAAQIPVSYRSQGLAAPAPDRAVQKARQVAQTDIVNAIGEQARNETTLDALKRESATPERLSTVLSIPEINIDDRAGIVAPALSRVLAKPDTTAVNLASRFSTEITQVAREKGVEEVDAGPYVARIAEPRALTAITRAVATNRVLSGLQDESLGGAGQISRAITSTALPELRGDQATAMKVAASLEGTLANKGISSANFQPILRKEMEGQGIAAPERERFSAELAKPQNLSAIREFSTAQNDLSALRDSSVPREAVSTAMVMSPQVSTSSPRIAGQLAQAVKSAPDTDSLRRVVLALPDIPSEERARLSAEVSSPGTLSAIRETAAMDSGLRAFQSKPRDVSQDILASPVVSTTDTRIAQDLSRIFSDVAKTSTAQTLQPNLRSAIDTRLSSLAPDTRARLSTEMASSAFVAEVSGINTGSTSLGELRSLAPSTDLLADTYSNVSGVKLTSTADYNRVARVVSSSLNNPKNTTTQDVMRDVGQQIESGDLADLRDQINAASLTNNRMFNAIAYRSRTEEQPMRILKETAPTTAEVFPVISAAPEAQSLETDQVRAVAALMARVYTSVDRPSQIPDRTQQSFRTAAQTGGELAAVGISSGQAADLAQRFAANDRLLPAVAHEVERSSPLRAVQNAGARAEDVDRTMDRVPELASLKASLKESNSVLMPAASELIASEVLPSVSSSVQIPDRTAAVLKQAVNTGRLQGVTSAQIDRLTETLSSTTDRFTSELARQATDARPLRDLQNVTGGVRAVDVQTATGGTSLDTLRENIDDETFRAASTLVADRVVPLSRNMSEVPVTMERVFVQAAADGQLGVIKGTDDRQVQAAQRLAADFSNAFPDMAANIESSAALRQLRTDQPDTPTLSRQIEASPQVAIRDNKPLADAVAGLASEVYGNANLTSPVDVRNAMQIGLNKLADSQPDLGLSPSAVPDLAANLTNRSFMAETAQEARTANQFSRVKGAEIEAPQYRQAVEEIAGISPSQSSGVTELMMNVVTRSDSFTALSGAGRAEVEQGLTAMGIPDRVASQQARTLTSRQMIGNLVGRIPERVEQTGGIDLAGGMMGLQIKRDGKGVPLPLSQQNVEQINIDGLYPVILDISPADKDSIPDFSRRTAGFEAAGDVVLSLNK